MALEMQLKIGLGREVKLGEPGQREGTQGRYLGVARPPESVRSLGPKRLLEGGFSSEDQVLFRVGCVCVRVFVFVVVCIW